ncbi:hypothetical protein M514_02560 [Trichuris suis]|uniref:Uncharacterized protein n=1 Tax=Trichuris suis TaxID=68888 RepID=A0A085MGW0_9BILA|nr:hypothetical protein M513_02560 [Trichuris suis]KFD70984.1 hypothetical protein M514_02560 [Trichuris suis]
MGSVSEPSATNGRKPNSPYDTMVTVSLRQPAMSIQWLPYDGCSTSSGSTGSGFIKRKLIVGSVNGLLKIYDAKLPGSNYSEQYCSSGPLRIVKAIAIDREIIRVRCMPQRSSIVAVKCRRPEVIVVNLGSPSSFQETEKVTVEKLDSVNHLKLRGHYNERFGLSWNEMLAGYLLSGGRDGILCVWDVNRAAERHVICSPIYDWMTYGVPIIDVCWSSMTPSVFAYVNYDGELVFEDIRTIGKRPPAIAKAGDYGMPTTVAFNGKNGLLALTGATDGIIKVWDVRKLQREAYRIDGARRAIHTLAWCPAKAKVFAAANTTPGVTIYDVSTKVDEGFRRSTNSLLGDELLFTHTVHSGEVTDLCWDNEIAWMIASVSNDGLCTLWKVSENIRRVNDTFLSSLASTDLGDALGLVPTDQSSK